MREIAPSTPRRGQSRGQGQATDIAGAAVAGLVLEPHRRRFERTGNGVHLLLAFRDARRFRVPLPEWLLRQLDRSIDQLLRPGGTASAKAVAAAFGLATPKGGRSALARAKTDLRHSTILERLAYVMSVNGPGKDELSWAAVAAHFGIATETVRDLYYARLASLKLAK